jgi:uncharacterized protein (TIGR02231 family)
MKTISILAATALMLTLVSTAADTAAQDTRTSRPVPSKVTAATIFLQGAELTATARLSLVEGANEVSIEGLSPGVDPASIRVNIGGGVVVSAHEYSIDHLSSSAAPSARIKMLKDSIDIYNAQIARTDIDIKINSQMQSYLETGIAKNVSGSEAGLGVEELRRTMDYYKSKSEEILGGARELQKRRTGIRAALARVNSQLAEEGGAGGRSSGVLKLNLTSPAAATHTATITYFTRQASWSPYYDISAEGIDRPITIAARSRVSQHTGLDWENVRLTLSTSVPSNGRVAPLFETWILRPSPVPAALMQEMAMAPAAQNTVSYDQTVEESVEDVVVTAYGTQRKTGMLGAVPYSAPAIYDHVTTAEGALNVTYDIDLPYTIPGNGKEQTIDLAVKETPAEYKYYCAPRLDGATYLIAEITGWESLGLLSAPANVTYDGTYIGQTVIDASATQEKLALTLGADKRVAVTRELAEEFSSTRATGSTVEQTFAYRLTVRNNQTRPVAMVLKDQYPTSTDRAIVVTLDTKATTPPTATREDLGVVTWEGTFSPGEVRVHTFTYTVRHPREMLLDL